MPNPDSSLDSYDRSITNAIVFTALDVYVYFQFPPRIITESNSSSWEQHDIWAIEPLKIHKGSDGRKLNMEWEYLASSKIWTPRTIASNLRTLKQYFFAFKRIEYPLVKIKYGQVIPSKINWRLMSVNVTYSKELFGKGVNIHPLHTVVSVSLELATTVNVKDSGGGAFAGGVSASETEAAKLQVDPLRTIEPSWY